MLCSFELLPEAHGRRRGGRRGVGGAAGEAAVAAEAGAATRTPDMAQPQVLGLLCSLLLSQGARASERASELTLWLRRGMEN